MPDRRREDKDAAGPDWISAAVFHIQCACASDDVLRFLGGIGVPAQPRARFDLIDDRRRRGRPAMSAIDRESASPFDRWIILCPNLCAREFLGCNNWIYNFVPPFALIENDLNLMMNRFK